MNPKDRRWWPVGVLLLGVALTAGGVKAQHSMQLRMPLDEAVPRVLDGWTAHDLEISEAEQRVAGMSSFVMRLYAPEGEDVTSAAAFSVYVGFYERQFQGRTIHSPKNCLPGGGWEPLVASREVIDTPLGAVPVNRYLIGNGPAKALVLYWYQGRGRIAANEYAVKWDLLRDQALHGRSDEALVRVIVPVTTTEEAAYAQALRVAGELAGSVDRALPPRQAGSAGRAVPVSGNLSGLVPRAGVPEPIGTNLVGAGLLGMVIVRRRRQQATKADVL